MTFKHSAESDLYNFLTSDHEDALNQMPDIYEDVKRDEKRRKKIYFIDPKRGHSIPNPNRIANTWSLEPINEDTYGCALRMRWWRVSRLPQTGTLSIWRYSSLLKGTSTLLQQCFCTSPATSTLSNFSAPTEAWTSNASTSEPSPQQFTETDWRGRNWEA